MQKNCLPILSLKIIQTISRIINKKMFKIDKKKKWCHNAQESKVNQFIFLRMVKKMNEKKIKLAGTEEVRDFVREAGKCDFDIDISYNRVIIDAKSFLGVLSLDLNRELTVKYGGHDMNFENVLSKYATA